MSESKPAITIKRNGPYVVSGITAFTNSRGEPIETKDVMSLCRCGQSKNKPFCDGTHRECGFTDEKN